MHFYLSFYCGIFYPESGFQVSPYTRNNDCAFAKAICTYYGMAAQGSILRRYKPYVQIMYAFYFRISLYLFSYPINTYAYSLFENISLYTGGPLPVMLSIIFMLSHLNLPSVMLTAFSDFISSPQFPFILAIVRCGVNSLLSIRMMPFKHVLRELNMLFICRLPSFMLMYAILGFSSSKNFTSPNDM